MRRLRSFSAPFVPIATVAMLSVAHPADPQNQIQPLLPNLAVDEALVAVTQQAFFEDCESQGLLSRGLNCRCVADRYPVARLQKLSDQLRFLQRTNQTAPLGILSTPRAQMDYDTKNGTSSDVEGGAASSGPEVLKTVFNHYYNRVGSQCKDGSVLARQQETDCLTQSSLTLNPGVALADFCACYADEFKRLFETTPGPASPSAAVSYAGPATLKCVNPPKASPTRPKVEIPKPPEPPGPAPVVAHPLAGRWRRAEANAPSLSFIIDYQGKGSFSLQDERLGERARLRLNLTCNTNWTPCTVEADPALNVTKAFARTQNNGLVVQVLYGDGKMELRMFEVQREGELTVLSLAGTTGSSRYVR